MLQHLSSVHYYYEEACCQQDAVEIVVYRHRIFSVNRVETIFVVIDVIDIYQHICIRMMITYVMLVRIVMYTASVGMLSIV